MSYLLSEGYTVNIITGFDETRDREIAKCKCLLNIHGQFMNEPSSIFEHIRCNRLLYAGYNVLSETSQDLDEEFIQQFPNLTFKKYSEFLKMKKEYDFIFYYNDFTIELIKDYLHNLGNVKVTNDKNELYGDNVVVVYEFKGEADVSNFSLLNTEPLTIKSRLHNILVNNKKYKKIYDYSLGNINIMKKHGITNCEYLPYKTSVAEKELLVKLKKENDEIYDYGIITGAGCSPNNLSPKRRKDVVDYLISRGITVHIISGWGLDRDTELSKCKCILNIHGEHYGESGTVFERIRCTRLLDAGYHILSEASDDTDDLHYPHLKFIEYTDFFKLF